MRINVYEAACDVGYTRVYFRGIDKQRLVKTATGEPATGGLMEGRLLEDFPQESDALESFILALASEGFPIHTRQFSSALNTAIDAIVNNV